MRQTAILYLDESLRRSARAGRHNFIGHLIAVLRESGHDVDLRPEEEAPRHQRGRAITHMRPPPPGGLCFRRVYHYPFWGIEPTSQRWDWAVAKATYSPETVPKGPADRIYTRWRSRLFPEATEGTTQEGFVYVPLQGRLLQHRRFQSCSPLEMLSHTLVAEPDRQVIAALHPKEEYSLAEHDALRALQQVHPRLTVQTGGMEDLLRRCDYVVTMNSAAAFNGFFFGKPAILFGRIDFHHITLSASPADLTAFHRIDTHRPDYARYLWWFWQEQSINAGRPDVRDRIRAALLRGGWTLTGEAQR